MTVQSFPASPPVTGCVPGAGLVAGAVALPAGGEVLFPGDVGLVAGIAPLVAGG